MKILLDDISLGNEVWKSIPHYRRYEVSSMGRVRSLTKKDRTLSLIPSSGLYLRAQMYNDEGIQKAVSVSRLVASAFIENPLGIEQVNHKNENVQDNRVENLEWCSPKYNSNYGSRGKRIAKKLAKTVIQMDMHGEFVMKHESTIQAARSFGFDSSAISKCCLGKLMSHKNYRWKYE